MPAQHERSRASSTVVRSGGKFFGDFFPTRQSAVIFVSYMVLFVAQSILVKASQTSHGYRYNVTCVVMLIELLKLILSCVLYLNEHSVRTLVVDVSKHRRVLLLYFVPALLYCFYNNLQFRNLRHFDPTTYNLLMQFRVVITGVVFQLLFRKRLSAQQWFSLCLLTVGCLVKQFSVSELSARSANSVHEMFESLFSLEILYLLFQMLCSCLAGVYNEFLLKDTGAELHIMIHNLFMYLDSIVCNLVMLSWNGELGALGHLDSWRDIFGHRIVLLIIANGALSGMIVAVFLRSLNSILKTFAGALDLSFTALVCWIVFSIPVDAPTIVAITIVSIATYLYSQNPVVNRVKETKVKCSVDEEDKAKLLAEQVV